MAKKTGESEIGNLRSKAICSLTWSFAAKLVSQGGTFLATILLARILGAGEFGLVALSLVYIGFVQIFIDAGFLHALVQRSALTQRELSGCFWLLLVAGCGAFSISLLASDSLDGLFAVTGIGLIIAVQSSIFLFLPFRIIAQALLSRDICLDEMSKRETAISVLRLATSLCMAWQGFGVWSLVIPQVVGEIAFSLACYRRAGWRLTAEFDWKALKPLLRFGTDISLSRIIWFAANRVDQLIIGRVLGTEALGFYSLALQFASALPQFASATLSRVAFPVFAMLQHDPFRLKKAFIGVMRYMTLACLPAFAGIALVAPDLLGLVFAPSWLQAVVPLQVLCILAFLKLMEAMAGFVVNARGRTRLNLRFNVLTLVVSTVGILIGTRLGGVSAVACMATISFVPIVLLVMRAAMRECGGGLGDLLAVVRFPAVATLAMIIAVLCIETLLSGAGHVHRLIAMVAVGGAVYAAVMVRLSPGIIGEIRNELPRCQTA